MTEKEKMLAGELYQGNEKQILKERQQAKEICYQYNQLTPTQIEEKDSLLKQLFYKVGRDCWIEAPFACDYGSQIEIGDYFYANHNLVILDGNHVTIGDHVFIGPNCGIYTAGHPLEVEKRNQGWEYAKPIKIGNNVWIGGNVVILPGVTIGDNVVIGAGSVVNKDIPNHVIAVGNPCRVVREQIE